MQEIIIEISTDAEVKVQVKGVKGKSCKDLTKDFEEKLGKVASDVATEEMYQHGDTNLRSRV